ncbi:MAG: TonB-dependent receptor [Erythrobacter sp.]
MQIDTIQALDWRSALLEVGFMNALSKLLSSTGVLALSVSVSFGAAPAVAQVTIAEVQDEQTAVEDLASDGGIVVTADRVRGQVLVEQAPILELNEADIEGIGANSLVELLEVVAPQTSSSRRRGGSGGGGPAILVNGLRISSFRELRSYPPESIRKVEILPEEVAVKFGFSADQRVVNLILKDNFSSREIEVEYEGPSEGGYAVREAEFTLLKLDQGKRLNINAEIESTSILDESERGIIQTDGSLSDIASDPNPARFRSLVDDALEIEATVNWSSSNLDTGALFSLNGTYEREENTSLSGLNSVLLTDPNGAQALRTFGEETPLRTRSSSDNFSTGSTYTRPLGGFQFTATANATLAETKTLIDREFDAQAFIDAASAGTLPLDGMLPTMADNGFDTARNRVIVSDNQVTFRGNPFLLPAGEVSTNFDIGFEWRRIESDDTRTDIETRLSRSIWEVGANVGVPLSERGGHWGAIGDVTLNFTGGLEELSDFGTLLDGSAGLTWGVADSLSFSASYIYKEVAPSLSRLGSPQITTFNVPVFDFVTGESVLASVTTGGNPTLQSETQRDWKFGLNWELPVLSNTRFNAEYIRNRSSNVTSSFPSISQAVEAAFPGRIERDGSGRLISLDRRPVTFDRTQSERLVFGLTTRGSFGAGQARRGPPRGERPTTLNAAERPNRPPRADAGIERRAKPENAPTEGASKPDSEGAPGPSTRPSTGSSTGSSTGPSTGPSTRASRVATRGFGRDGRGRYFVNLSHSIELDNTIQIAAGSPILDQLAGDTTQALGFARHQSTMRAGIFRKGKGGRVTAAYTGSARVNGSGLPGSSDLFIDDLLTIDLRLFANLGEVFGKQDTFLGDVRIALRADNVFNARRNVRDANGDVPLTFQPALLDPTGRYVGIDIRKMF